MKLILDKKSLSDGLEIVIKGCTGNPADKEPGSVMFFEYYNDKVQVHIWDGTQQDPQTVTLKQINKGE